MDGAHIILTLLVVALFVLIALAQRELRRDDKLVASLRKRIDAEMRASAGLEERLNGERHAAAIDRAACAAAIKLRDKADLALQHQNKVVLALSKELRHAEAALKRAAERAAK